MARPMLLASVRSSDLMAASPTLSRWVVRLRLPAGAGAGVGVGERGLFSVAMLSAYQRRRPPKMAPAMARPTLLAIERTIDLVNASP